MTDHFVERRRWVRVFARIEARLQLLLPDETFSPVPLRGHTCDISLGGLRFETAETSQDLYDVVIRHVRYVRILITLPGSEAEGEKLLFGRVVWIKRDEHVTPAVTAFGVMFENLGTGETKAVERCVSHLRARIPLGGKLLDVRNDGGRGRGKGSSKD